MGSLYWFIFLCGIVVFAVIFGRKLTEFVEYSDYVEESVMQQIAAQDAGVLGLTDEVDGESSEEAADESEKPSEEDVAALVDEIEEERKEALRQKLLLQLPDETDNPNHPVTFVEPTDKGVEVQVDGGGFSKTDSPMALPALAIGKHTLNFRFEDEEETTQNLEEQVIVIPRAPVWSEEQKVSFRSDELVVMEGTALPRSRVILLVSSAIVTDEIEADDEGFWSVALEEELPTGEHSAVSFVRKDGYASNFSEPLVFTVGPVEAAEEDVGKEEMVDSGSSDAMFSFLDDLVTEENYVLVFASLGGLAVGIILLVSALTRMFKKRDGFEAILNKQRAKSDREEGVSLREKFAKAGLKVEKGEDEEDGDGNDEEDDDDDDDDEEDKEEKETEEKPQKENEKKEKDKKDKTSKEPLHEKEERTEEQGESDRSEKPEEPEEPKPGKVYSKDEFLKKFKRSPAKGKSSKGSESNKIKISLTSGDRGN